MARANRSERPQNRICYGLTLPLARHWIRTAIKSWPDVQLFRIGTKFTNYWRGTVRRHRWSQVRQLFRRTTFFIVRGCDWRNQILRFCKNFEENLRGASQCAKKFRRARKICAKILIVETFTPPDMLINRFRWQLSLYTRTYTRTPSYYNLLPLFHRTLVFTLVHLVSTKLTYGCEVKNIVNRRKTRVPSRGGGRGGRLDEQVCEL